MKGWDVSHVAISRTPNSSLTRNMDGGGILEGEYVERDYQDVAYIIDVGLLNENLAY
jgi:hypothetical protein